jgi:hypothetical protein
MNRLKALRAAYKEIRSVGKQRKTMHVRTH